MSVFTLLLLGPIAHAQDTAGAASALRSGADQARYWQWGWSAFYGGSSAYSLVHARDTDDPEERYDDYINATKAALGLAGTLLFAPSHGDAYRQYQAMDDKASPEARAATRILIAGLAEEEARQRRWQSRLGGLIVNGLAGLAIGVEDNRPGDGWVNFATGMLTTELNVRTRPDTATAFLEREPDFLLKANGAALPIYVDWAVGPMFASVEIRY
ncbi:MAG TPA: hypothetical protein DD710_10160 [Alcanivorax sp.]|nr:hypothetical protein [Alcanivorax sp.]HAD44865.1 hypothetical protein [Alcanivorax sp.]HAI34274.1 hypothetical protein [Alcanivorax sp.]HAI90508.1 hypothetical protein [Alcanivorax sp.]HBP68622.1 hypothetical protein [Alcanivorax sp.]